MDSTTDEFEELGKDPDRLREYLSEHINEISRTLNDDEDFCNRDIDATIEYVKNMKKKFIEKFQEFENKLEEIRRDNQKTSEDNKKKFNNEIQEINGLFKSEKYHEAWKKFQDYEKSFQQRSTVIQQIPKLHMNETDIERCFSPDHRSTTTTTDPSSTQSITTISTATDDEKPDSFDDTSMTSKEQKRKKKVIETVHITDDNEETNTEKNEQTIDHSQFGARSRRTENQQTTTTTPPATNSAQRKYCLSNRLNTNSNKTNLEFSGRNISTTPNNHLDQRPPIPPNSISQRQNINLTLNPVSHYQHDRNKILLMACNYQYIILFKSQRNRLDLWHLGTIERGTQTVQNLDWHDGLIISMGCINNDHIFMFTERGFFIYSLSQHRKLDSRILPRGSDDGYELSNSSTEYQRGIGTVYDKHWYHIYLNRSNHWTLSKHTLDKSTHLGDEDLTRYFPDVARFIHLSVNEKTISFLVQMNDLSYAVVFHPIHNFSSPIILLGAQQPLTIYSAYNQSLKEHICFINDPSIDVLHIVIKDRYLQSYPMTAYAIYYFAEKHELMIVDNNLISSININKLNLVF